MKAKLEWATIVVLFGGIVLTNLVSKTVGAAVMFTGLVLLTVMLSRQWHRIAVNLSPPVRREIRRWWLVGMLGTTLLGVGFITMLDTPWLFAGVSVMTTGVVIFLVFLVHEYRANERDYAQIRRHFAEAELAQEEEAHRAAGDAAE